jgi:ribosomal-protein-alanine N-acetyltransferase
MESEYLHVTRKDELPDWAPLSEVITFFHETMKPWHDTPEDVAAALDYLFSDAEGKGGRLTLLRVDGKLGGALAMLDTGMSGYVPSNILLFVSIDPDLRGKGLGGQLVSEAIAQCEGDVKLHVEYENPAKRLYERLGFETKYAEMRLKRR